MLAPDCTLVVPVPRSDPLLLHLHTRYLAANSLFFTALFTGADFSPRLPCSRLPRLLKSPPHPIVFLPVPDPSSIQLLFHWLYSRNTVHLDRALHRGLIQWPNLARNVEYLGFPTDIKVFLGRWYRDWSLHDTPSDEPDDSDESQSGGNGDRGRSRDVKPLVQLCAQLRLCTP